MKQNRTTITLAALLLLLPAALQATTQSSTNYSINAGRILSGGTASTDVTGLSKSGIAIGQAVFIPGGKTSSPSFSSSSNTVLTIWRSDAGSLLAHSGDINGDGAVDIVDALLALKNGIGLVTLTSSEVSRGDVGPLVRGVAVGDGRIDIEDTILILRKAVGNSW